MIWQHDYLTESKVLNLQKKHKKKTKSSTSNTAIAIVKPKAIDNSGMFIWWQQFSIFKLIVIWSLYLAAYSCNTLLEPIRNATNTSLDESTRSQASKQQDKSSEDMFKLTGSLDPFNDMELKTLNDFEELKAILHNHIFNLQPQSSQPASSLKVDSPQLQTQPQRTGLDNFGLPKISFIDLDYKEL